MPGCPQSFQCPAPDFGSGRGPRVMGLKPSSGSTLSTEPAYDFLFPPLPPPQPMVSVPLNNNNNFNESCNNIGVIEIVLLCLEYVTKKKKKSNSDN